MYYLFISTPEEKMHVQFIKVENYRKLRQTVQKQQSNALFFFNETTDEINIVSYYYDLIECSYFIYSLLGIYRLAKDLKVYYPNSI